MGHHRSTCIGFLKHQKSGWILEVCRYRGTYSIDIPPGRGRRWVRIESKDRDECERKALEKADEMVAKMWKRWTEL